jgi:GT2 family glycosyltransferase
LTGDRAVKRDLVVVIPTFNKAGKLRPLLDALAGQTLDRDRFEVVAVDDCSTDGTAEILAEMGERLPIAFRAARTERNAGGPSAPRNVGWRSSRAPVVAFLDDDCLPEPGWLEAALSDMQAHPTWGVMQGRTIAPPEVDIRRLTGWQVFRVVDGPGPLFEATNIFYRREALEKLGGFDENISWWGEDTDLGWRVLEAGWESGFSNDAVVVHEVADRGWKWHVKFGWLDHRVIEVAARHPEFRRRSFWRPWAMNRVDAEFALALAGFALSPKWKPAAIVSLPYLWRRRPPFRRDGITLGSIEFGLQRVVVDSVRFAGHMKGSISARILVL